MKVLMAGGGSGGHVTPLRAVMNELKKMSSDTLHLTVVTDRSFYEQTRYLFDGESDVVIKKIFSGKFRRYNSKSFMWHLTHLPTVLKNVRDLFYIVLGTVQSAVLFITDKPDIVFAKGGFVCVPIGIGARLFKVPLIIHDSDTHPGLTNRILSRWAKVIATGMPAKYYPYPAKKMVYTGIPISDLFTPAAEATRGAYKTELGFSSRSPLLLVTGGGTGAQILNEATLQCAPELLGKRWQIALVTGKNKAKNAQKFLESLPDDQKQAFKVYEFTELALLVLAADVIVTRAGATAMQEFANAKKRVVIVPSPYLTGAHQLKNAQMFLEQNAALVVQESELNQSSQLIDAVERAAKDGAVASRLHASFAKPEAARKLAELILQK